MSLERKDIRGKLDPELHTALKIFADLDGVTEAEFIEAIIVPVLRRRIADATLAVSALQKAGIIGNNHEDAGALAKWRR